jgi:hypothetical protein
MEEPNYIDAVNSLAKDKFHLCSCDPDVGVVWKEDATGLPTEEEIQTELVRLEAEWVTQEYARNRAADYPNAGTQFNKIYDDGLTKWKSEMVDPVKTKWPKDNSGPV